MFIIVAIMFVGTLIAIYMIVGYEKKTKKKRKSGKQRR